MKNKVKSITEKVPQVATLPDGLYNGVWGGCVINVTYEEKRFELATEIGVKGIGIKVVVAVEDGEATFDTVRT